MPQATAAAAAAARPAGVVPHIPGIVRFAEQCIGRQRDQPELRSVRLADDDGAGALQPFDDRLVMIRHEILEQLRAERGTDAGRQVQILDRDRHAPQRRQLVAAHHGRLGLAGLRRASSSQRVTMAVNCPLSRSACASAASTASTGERRRADRPGQLLGTQKAKIIGHDGRRSRRDDPTRESSMVEERLAPRHFCQRPVGLLSWRRARRGCQTNDASVARRNFQTPPAPTDGRPPYFATPPDRERIKP